MCLKAIGVELPLMEGTRPYVMLQVLYDDGLVWAQRMRRSHLPLRTSLPPDMAALLALDQRKRGERRPKRLTLGRCCRFPYHYYMVKLPGAGLHFPDGDLCHLSLRVWVELYDPLAYVPLFHLLGSDPLVDRFGRTHWRTHRDWSSASRFGTVEHTWDETSCGCGVRVTMRYASTGAGSEQRVQRWYVHAHPRPYAHPHTGPEGCPATNSGS